MPTLAAGSKRCAAGADRRAHLRGLTLLELLVVLGIIALATAGVVSALPEPAQTRLEHEAVRLAALLESARAQSRLHGSLVRWQAEEGGFRFSGLPEGSLPRTWLYPETRVDGGPLQLGPDPIIAPQGVWLRNQDAPLLRWRVASDGLHPFAAAAQAVP